MLHILVGSSGVGKTSIIEKLNRDYSWQLVETITTRDIRPTDVNKKQVKESEFKQLEEKGCFFAIQNVYKNKYGQLKYAIQKTIENNKENWIFDLSLEAVEPYKKLHPKLYLILPINTQQLEKQLSTRSDRIKEAINDYQKLWSLKNELEQQGFKIIYNQPDKLEQVIIEILKYSKLS